MLQRVLLSLDVGLPGASVRIALGSALVLFLHLLVPRAGLVAAAGWLAAVLFGWKAFAAVARRAAPASPSVRAQWEWRRHLARNYDSYQWRKLLWLGCGILAAAFAVPRQAGWEVRLGGACVLSGSLAEAIWRRKKLPLTQPESR